CLEMLRQASRRGRLSKRSRGSLRRARVSGISRKDRKSWQVLPASFGPDATLGENASDDEYARLCMSHGRKVITANATGAMNDMPDAFRIVDLFESEQQENQQWSSASGGSITILRNFAPCLSSGPAGPPDEIHHIMWSRFYVLVWLRKC
ncbi:hypothetical protein CCHR01_00920, partial [Colletotrichum chrysophilum]